MAWYEFERDQVKGMTGDEPMDEFALAMMRVARAYDSQFSRKPTVAELLHAFQIVIGARPEAYLSDPEGVRFAELRIDRNLEIERDYVDVLQYEGTYTDRTIPGSHLVVTKGGGGA